MHIDALVYVIMRERKKEIFIQMYGFCISMHMSVFHYAFLEGTIILIHKIRDKRNQTLTL